jgi:hypothetical protein
MGSGAATIAKKKSIAEDQRGGNLELKYGRDIHRPTGTERETEVTNGEGKPLPGVAEGRILQGDDEWRG